MKITLELDTDIPAQMQILHQILNPAPDVRTLADQPVAPAVPSDVSKQWKQASQTASQLVPQPVAPTPQSPVQQLPLPTPSEDLRDQLNKSFAAAFNKDPGAAETLSAQLRTQWGPEAKNWTEEQLKEAITRTQALVTF